MSRKTSNLERELEEFNSHLRKNGYEPINWSNKNSMLNPLLSKLVEVSNEMENEIQIKNNLNKLEEVESDREVVMCGLRVLRNVIDISEDK